MFGMGIMLGNSKAAAHVAVDLKSWIQCDKKNMPDQLPCFATQPSYQTPKMYASYLQIQKRLVHSLYKKWLHGMFLMYMDWTSFRTKAWDKNNVKQKRAKQWK